jgi:thiol-disulfide isomerase/thioredoxin
MDCFGGIAQDTEVFMAYKSIRWFFGAAVVFFTAASFIVQAADDKPTRRERFEALKTEYDKQLAAFRKADRAVLTNADREVADKLRPDANEFGKRFLALAEEKLADELSGDALFWIAYKYGQREKLHLDRALDLIEKHHLNSPKLKDAVVSLATADSERANKLAETIAEQAGSREVRGFATLFVGYGIYYRTGGVKEKELAQIELWMERVQKDYADVKFENRTLGEMAEAQMYELRNLIPGRVAPEIEGVGIHGMKLKLSDYRGKVVVLVFWGSWCGPCMAEVPQWRDMVAKYAKRPFTIVGVNSGDTLDKAKTVLKAEKMTWPIFFDGEDGPIVRKWNVTGFPTIYMIDAKGIILHRIAVDDTEKAIEYLVREVERK